MELFLLRHGKPDIGGLTAIRSVDMFPWLSEYDAAGILGAPDVSMVAAGDGQYIVSSPMRRALESVAALGVAPDIIIDELYETPLPVFSIPLLKLTPLVWAVLFRVFWMAGGDRGVESFSAVKLRAKRVSGELDKIAQTHGHVVSVGHGIYECPYCQRATEGRLAKAESQGIRLLVGH